MGLGKLFATNAVREGAATVILWDANENALSKTAEELEAAGGNIRYEVVDVTSQDRVTDAAARGPHGGRRGSRAVQQRRDRAWQRLLLGEQSRDFLLTMEVNSIGPHAGGP